MIRDAPIDIVQIFFDRVNNGRHTYQSINIGFSIDLQIFRNPLEI